MKVVMLSKSAFPFHVYGGLEKFVYYLGKNLVKEGVGVEIVTSSGRSEVRTVNGLKYTFIPPPLNSRPSNFPRLAKLAHSFFLYNLFNIAAARYLNKKKFDLLHSYERTSERYLHLKNRRPTIVQSFNNEICKFEGLEKVLVLPAVQQLRYCMTHCDAVASEGEFQIEEIVTLFGVNKEKIIVIPVGVDLRSINEGLEKNIITRKELGFDDNDFVLISVNRLSPVKGINYLLDSFSIVKAHIDSAKLLLIGTGPEEDRIKKHMQNLGVSESVVHVKDVSESLLYNYYRLADLYVSPTLQNDFIMSILEAMACGLPVVSTGQNFVVHYNRNGYIVPKRNAGAIAEAVLKIYDRNECKRMGDESRKIIKEYDWGIIAKKAIKEYERLMS